MTEFVLSLANANIQLVTSTAVELGMTHELVAPGETNSSVRFRYGGRTISGLMLIRFGRLIENKLVFQDEVNIASYWKELFTQKQRDIIADEEATA